MILLRLPCQALTVIGLLVCTVSAAFAGAWGEGSFDNDDALDWAAECAAAKTIAPVREALERAVRAKYLEAPEGSVAVAAAEVIAGAKGKPSQKLPADLATWIKRQDRAALARLAPLALKVLAKIQDPKRSELRQLWDEGDPKKWIRATRDLEGRLR